MAAAAEVQALLRFLTKDAKIPWPEAMPKIGMLRKTGLVSPLAIAQAELSSVQNVFVDEKLVKQVVNAAKRVSNPKKRSASELTSPTNKRSRADGQSHTRDIESELALPDIDIPVEELENVYIETNRAPLVLAFAVASLEFSMPTQPLSSRLSLAQALVSANSQNKAKSIGLASGPTAEDEGWAKGQPRAKVLGREIAVMRRQMHTESQQPEPDNQETVKKEEVPTHDAFWGLDLDALRKSNGPLVAGKLTVSQGPPIHTPLASRSYLLRSISMADPDPTLENTMAKPKKKQTAAEAAAMKEQAAAMLLKSIRAVCESWASTLSATDLDRRAWSWYLTVRPEVAQGQSGWGQRGRVRLGDILKLRRNV